MDKQVQSIKTELNRLVDVKHANKGVISDYLKRLDENSNLIRDTNPIDHFCTFFVPINLQSKSIFMGHHKKANAWVPPGGHMDEYETPIETVRREFREELNHELKDEITKLFTITKVDINLPNVPCKVHRDFWYLVFTEKIDFYYDKKEFYEATWISIRETKKLNKFTEFEDIYKALEKKYG